MASIAIQPIDHKLPEQAEMIRRVFYDAYRVEAQLLQLAEADFFPLQRTAEHIQASEALFLGGYLSQKLVAVAEIEAEGPAQINIGSFVVMPDVFRQGIGSTLLRHILAAYAGFDITVSTGQANTPAIGLYEKHSFAPQKTWHTPDGIPMMTLLHKGQIEARGPSTASEIMKPPLADEPDNTSRPNKTQSRPIKQGDIFWIRADNLDEPELGSYPHPYVVVQDDLFNHSRIHSVVVCALTTNMKQADAPGNVRLEPGEANLPKPSIVVVSKISAVPKAQLGEFVGTLSTQRVQHILAGIRFLQSSFFRDAHG
ncbi:MAG: GNAT family N-acetyltransferase [Ardenticatenaceae bacterium]|nr:GNAT family N-acetyltransferase [Ardenticatenaceae bacterium]